MKLVVRMTNVYRSEKSELLYYTKLFSGIVKHFFIKNCYIDIAAGGDSGCPCE